MLITFNYKEGTKTITFGEAKEATDQAAPGSDLDCCGAPQKSLENTEFSRLFAILFPVGALLLGNVFI